MNTPRSDASPSAPLLRSAHTAAAQSKRLATGLLALGLTAGAAMAQGAPRPNGELDGPGFFKIMLTTVLVIAVVLVPSIMPSKRGHQD